MDAYAVRQISPTDTAGVLQVFNSHVKQGNAAFHDRKVGLEFFQGLKKASLTGSFLVATYYDRVVGFALLSAYHSSPVFSRTAKVSYFLVKDHTGKGVGSRLLAMLEMSARKQGVTILIAAIAHNNLDSIAFHEKRGFDRCGLFENVGHKHGEDFSVVYMRKAL